MIAVRRAGPDDVAEILRLIRALAAFEHEPDAVHATPEGLRAALFGEPPRAFAHVAVAGARIVGLALWFFNFSTWTGRPGLYLEDLFVEPDMRGHGVARALFAALAREAAANDCPRIDWAVLEWNEAAKAAYGALGGRHCREWEPWRIEGEALARLAAG